MKNFNSCTVKLRVIFSEKLKQPLQSEVAGSIIAFVDVIFPYLKINTL